MQRKATVIECAYLVGLAQMDFEISVQYAKDRIQFGRPIGSFQAIQHKAADMVTDVDGARFIMYRAAWSVDQDEADADMNVHMAKAWCSEATRRVVAHGQQIHGGIGFTKDYKVQLYFRRQKASELAWGDADYHRELVAEELEALARPPGRAEALQLLSSSVSNRRERIRCALPLQFDVVLAPIEDQSEGHVTQPTKETEMVKPIPEGYHTITPYLFVDGAARAIEVYKNAFNAQELMRHGRAGREGRARGDTDRRSHA